MAHITGGGLPENLPRALPDGLQARIDPGSWERPVLFRWLQENGEVPEADLWNTFNLGVGFCLVLPEAAVESALQVCREQGHQAWLLGVWSLAGGCGGHPGGIAVLIGPGLLPNCFRPGAEPGETASGR